MNVITKINTISGNTRINDNAYLGLDIGIASLGWALLDLKSRSIIGMGSWGFEPPEVPKTRKTKATTRRIARSQRRRLRRRRQRLRQIRILLHQHGLHDTPSAPENIKGQAKPDHDPWQLRADGLDRLLDRSEFSAVLIHIAKHRGYLSNSKAEKQTNAPPENRKVLKGLAEIVEKSAKYRTVGEMFARDEEFASKKRNRDNDYSHTIRRDLQEMEITKLFKAQRGFGSEYADPALEGEFSSVAFNQRPLQDSENLLGTCPFEPEEKRASSFAYSFERFRFASKMNTLTINDGTRSGRRMTREEINKALNGFGKNGKKINWKKLIQLCNLPKDTQFRGVSEKAMREDVARFKKGSANGSATLFGVLGEAIWNSLSKDAELLDKIAHVLTFREDVGRIRAGLEELSVDPLVLQALMEGLEKGEFADFSKAGHISTKAARNILPGLLEGMNYDKACAQAGYDHSLEHLADLDSISNPVAKRAITEALKQVNAIIRHYGYRPSRIHIELGRDVGKGALERGKIEKGIKDRTKAKQKAHDQLCEVLGRVKCSSGEVQRYEMWLEQKHFCLYCGTYIDPTWLADDVNATQIDHILPRGRSQDDSWNNKTLACISCNQEKKNQTPYEWFGKDEEHWARFEFNVQSLKEDGLIKGYKKRNLLMKDFSDHEAGFVERNLNDTRFAARVIMAELNKLYTEEESKGPGIRRVFARPAKITAVLRRSWGLDRYKFVESEQGSKKRIEDERHHGLDALIVATCTESTLQAMTKRIQILESRGLGSHRITELVEPWEGFAEDVKVAYANAHVARTENRRGRGEGHAATIRKIRIEDGKRITYERKSIENLTKADLERLKDPERNRDLYDALFEWIAAGKPKDQQPTRNNGHPIKKATLRSEENPTTQRSGFLVNEGQVDNGEMVRVDVFEKDNKFFLVPIYVHQVMDKQKWPHPPNSAINANKPENEWQLIDASFTFKFSLYPFSWIRVVSKGKTIEGYYRSTHRGTGAINLSIENSRAKSIEGIGARTLKSFQKYQVDRLGNKHEIKSEKRTWHGVVCT